MPNQTQIRLPSPKTKASDRTIPLQLICKTWPPKVSQATRTGKSRYGSPPYLPKHSRTMRRLFVCLLCFRHWDMKKKCKSDGWNLNGRAEVRTGQNDRNQCPNWMRHHKQHLLGALNSKWPAIDASPQGEHDQVCTARCRMNQNRGLEHPDSGLLDGKN